MKIAKRVPRTLGVQKRSRFVVVFIFCLLIQYNIIIESEIQISQVLCHSILQEDYLCQAHFLPIPLNFLTSCARRCDWDTALHGRIYAFFRQVFQEDLEAMNALTR